jgi:hypothetical protein
MAGKSRFSISMDAAVHAAVKRHAAAMGLDVSAYITAAVLRQMADDEVVVRRFADIDAAIAATEALQAPTGAGPDISEEDLAAARAGMAQALAAAEDHAA